MNTTLINQDFYDVTETGLKVVRIKYNNEFTKVDIGFLFSEERKNIIKITNDIYLSDYDTNKKLIECIGIELDEEIELKSIKDFRYFSLKFEPFEKIKKELMLMQDSPEILIVGIK